VWTRRSMITPIFGKQDGDSRASLNE
jgi:hypothetical protein